VVLNMTAVLPQMHGDAVGSAKLRLHRRPDRIGFISPPRLPNGRDMVDIDTKLDRCACVNSLTR
jgi:hypothetical protein